eukprot:scaffold653182_cov61-Prasinocladus_malaysianus.AAC.1
MPMLHQPAGQSMWMPWPTHGFPQSQQGWGFQAVPVAALQNMLSGAAMLPRQPNSIHMPVWPPLPMVSAPQQTQPVAPQAKNASVSGTVRTVNKCRKCQKPYMNPYHARDRTNKWICMSKVPDTKGEE